MRMVWLARWAALGALFGATACQTAGTPLPEVVGEAAKEPVEKASAEVKPEPVSQLDLVYFDYDRWNLRDDARRTLKENARKIQSSTGDGMLVVEGHCDERGSEEYNLALGDRRAATVARYLEDLGVPGSRLRTVSYGESKPAATGHDESAWSVNRRSEIRVDSRTASR